MPKEGQKNVTFSGQILIELEKRYAEEKSKNPTLSFAWFIADSAKLELERRGMLKDASFISPISIEGNIVTLKDARDNEKFVEVQFKGRKVRCLTDNKEDCIHVGFALALPEVRKVLMARGQ